MHFTAWYQILALDSVVVITQNCLARMEAFEYKFEYKEMKYVGVTDCTNQTPYEHFWTEKCLSSTPLKIEKIFIKCAQNRRCTSPICEQSLCKV